MVENEKRRKQFEYERMLRDRILNSNKNDRPKLYRLVYADLFSTFPDHSVFIPDEQRKRIGKLKAGMITPLLKTPSDVLEVGCGRGDVLAELAWLGHRCTGIEPSVDMIELCSKEVRIFDGCADKLEFPDSSFDLVFSQQVLEHLHPEDVPSHFAEAFRVLRSGGIFAVETPNRTTGPQDISRGFTRVAQGLHLKEWSVGELLREFQQAGFRQVKGLLAPPVLARRAALVYEISRVPGCIKWIQDALLKLVPGLAFRTICGKAIGLEDVFLFARKPF